MSFLNPWLAAALAALAVPALLILYFLKLRRREQLVPSTLLWKRTVQDLQVNAPFQRLRKNLLLLLQLLVLLAAILALARPVVQTTVPPEGRVVILIDRSASMNTREGEQTRLEQAKEQAIRLVKTFNQRGGGWRSFLSLGGSQAQIEVMVIAFSERASIIAPFAPNTSELVRLIAAIEPTDETTNLREALDLAEAYLAPPSRLGTGTEETPLAAERPTKLILLSDGRIRDLDKLVVRSGTLELLRVGAASDNVAITALRTQRNYEYPGSLDILVTVANFGHHPVSTDLSIYLDGVLTKVQSLALAARTHDRDTTEPGPLLKLDHTADDGAVRTLSLPLTLDRGALLEARLSRPDALSADNVAWAVIPPPRRQRVLVVSDGKYPFLSSVMRGLPLQEHPFVTPMQYEAARGEYETDGQSNFDIVVFDKYAPAQLPVGNYLFLGAVPKLPNVTVGESIRQHTLIWWNETHPTLRHVSLDYVYVAESHTVTLPPEAEVLVEGPRGPVMFRYTSQGRHCLVVTFPIEASTWWSKLSFGVFMYNAIRYLGGGNEADSNALRPGTPLRIAVAPGNTQVAVTAPDGRPQTLSPDSTGIVHFGGTTRVGVYQVAGAARGQETFAVNLEDEHESNIAPPTAPLKTATAEVRELAAIVGAGSEVWRWFVGAALLLVLLEWWVYNRRLML